MSIVVTIIGESVRNLTFAYFCTAVSPPSPPYTALIVSCAACKEMGRLLHPHFSKAIGNLMDKPIEI